MSPVHGKGDAIGKHRGERGLACRLDPIRQHSLVRHLCHQGGVSAAHKDCAFGGNDGHGTRDPEDAAYDGRRNPRPGRAVVRWPLSRTIAPFTMTYERPVGAAEASAGVP